ncbi:protein-L-isoaspartate(D-aspartate) O-methyltransferase [Roseateles violae]|uniref:Protein-L-isoaspartate O-methyltransferase n=1 Tax=Roseateles violae TaxID=3058042 RepID=A0ABT8DXX9_9BURK|nr:protein-L-isoaspartate(D-aspartate) O-methyltransferase [Pelomonas sp. PFR6]MDN3922354.1 protein-L-isoaspartate(D-aspartate) O-methyltransferase [Pelomonas sp. PFR6]
MTESAAGSAEESWVARRQRMVASQIANRGVRAPAVLEAMREVPRERFVDAALAEFAYEDSPLPIGQGQTISQPYIVAAMLEAARVARGDTVLEVGAGSGYATAVLSRIAARVCAIERHEALARLARQRLDALGYANVELIVGDGSSGWPGPLCFDVILVSAAGPEVPATLKEQLTIGGRLVMPVGERGRQRLVRLTRLDEQRYEQELIAPVQFVPLIGAHGWPEDERLPALLAAAAEPLPDIEDPAFGRLFDRYADRRVVMLGEATHGSSEFYRARAAITRRLVAEHGFEIVAVEADWPDAAAIDRHVRAREEAGAAPAGTPPFQRFPRWLWRNRDFAQFVGWLRRHNAAHERADGAVGFYGLDLYNLRGSIAAVLDYLDRVDPEAAQIARARYGCLTPWQQDPATYGRAARQPAFERCEAGVIAQCRELLQRRLGDAPADDDRFLDATQNARLIVAAERYYRVMYYGGADSWNLRDSHMFDTLRRLLDFRGPHAKAVVWAHNSHIGDARQTDMGSMRNEHNIGQLARQHFGEDRVALIGFGTHAGTVAAASDWDGEMQVMNLRPSLPDSYERICHDAALPQFLLDLSALRGGRRPALQRQLLEPRLERYVGVIYRPDSERWSHYAESTLPLQYDGFVWFDRTHALTPLPERPAAGQQLPDLYPFGL